MTSFPNPVDGRIVTVRSASDPKLPNGHAIFRLTQTFDSVNLQFSTKPHGANDFGNFVCGDRVLAVANGKAQTGTDSAGALRVILDHGDGWKTHYWHLDGWTIPQGVWVNVVKGQQIGIVGDTGLGAVCHLHFETVYSGVKRDPWPLLAQNQATQLPDTGTEEDMIDPNKHIPARLATILPGGTVYAKPDRSATLLKTWPLTNPVANVGLYAMPSPATGSPMPLAPIRIEVSGVLRVGWVGADKVQIQKDGATDVDSAVAAAVAPYQGRIANIKSKAALFASDIADD